MTTRAIIDGRNDVREIQGGNNVKYRTIHVLAAGSGSHSGAGLDFYSYVGLMGKPDLHFTFLTVSSTTSRKGEPVTVRV